MVYCDAAASGSQVSRADQLISELIWLVVAGLCGSIQGLQLGHHLRVPAEAASHVRCVSMNVTAQEGALQHIPGKTMHDA
jgi:2-keto-3-deoxy-galactonokinase